MLSYALDVNRLLPFRKVLRNLHEFIRRFLYIPTNTKKPLKFPSKGYLVSILEKRSKV